MMQNADELLKTIRNLAALDRNESARLHRRQQLWAQLETSVKSGAEPPALQVLVRVAEAIREVLTNADLKLLPVSCDDWCLDTIQRWRWKFSGLDLSQAIASEPDGSRMVYYTFLGSAANWLLADLLRQRYGVTVDGDAWRLSCSGRVEFDFLSGLQLRNLESLIETSIKRYADLFDPPRHYRYLPNELRCQEIASSFDLQRTLRQLRQLAFLTPRVANV